MSAYWKSTWWKRSRNLAIAPTSSTHPSANGGAGLIVSVPNALLEEPASREGAGAVAVFRTGADAAP